MLIIIITAQLVEKGWNFFSPEKVQGIMKKEITVWLK